MSLNDTPRAERVHIGIFGKTNAGKSSLINAITNQNTALVSDVAGTTTDPVYKSMEITGLGPVVFIDTAGIDDASDLGNLRVGQTEKAADKTDVAVVVFSDDEFSYEEEWIKKLNDRDIPFITVLNKTDSLDDAEETSKKIAGRFNIRPVLSSAKEGKGISDIIAALKEKIIGIGKDESTITNGLAKAGDSVLLVIPQDISAPKGRLILPQVQTIRELLDLGCTVTCCTDDRFSETLLKLRDAPKLIITDSQVFKRVYELKPMQSKITSFSVLFANYKGDLEYFIEGTRALELLNSDSKILIAEACTHVPAGEDIGTVKIPRMLRARYGEGLSIVSVRGADFPSDLSDYDLIIHCGACMFNKKHVLKRIADAKAQNVPMTNYGVVLAYLSGILDKISY